MNDKAIQYLALDVHQATTVASVRDERGRVVMRATVPTEGRALLALVRGLSRRSLTARAGAIAAGVPLDVLVSAVVTLLPNTAQGGRTASADRA